ncbi:desmocollin 1 [Cricetulus griseus]
MAVASAAPGSTFSKQLLFSLLVSNSQRIRELGMLAPASSCQLGLEMNLEECLKSPSTILSSDPAFRILEDGTIYTTRDLLLSSEQKRFSIFLSDSQSLLQKEIEIVLSAKETKVYGYATTADGYAPDYPLPLLFKVEDDNDNAPYFETKLTVFSVPENCRIEDSFVITKGPRLWQTVSLTTP